MPLPVSCLYIQMDIILSDYYLALIYNCCIIGDGSNIISAQDTSQACIDVCLHLRVNEFTYQVLHISL